MRLLWIAIIFLAIGGLIIASSYNLNLKRSEDRRTFLGKFSVWVVQVGKNVVRTAGYALKMDWLPEQEENKSLNYSNYVIDEG